MLLGAQLRGNAARRTGKALAEDRGLTLLEIAQLEHLARTAGEGVSDLIISPRRYDESVSRYVKHLRSRRLSGSEYFGVIVELTRLRRRIHPPGSLLRPLISTRELPEGTDVVATLVLSGSKGVASEQHEAVVWSVNEDHFDLRIDSWVPPTENSNGSESLGHSDGPGSHREGTEIRTPASVVLSFTRPGHGVYRLETAVRAYVDAPRPILRLEHTATLVRENRREHVRESVATALLVTPIGGHTPSTLSVVGGTGSKSSSGRDDRDPVRATLADISGGGLSFLIDGGDDTPSTGGRPPQPRLEAGQLVRIFMPLGDDPDRAPIMVLAKVLRVEKVGRRLRCQGEWESLRAGERDAIIRYVFELQRGRIKSERAAADAADSRDRVLVLVPGSGDGNSVIAPPPVASIDPRHR